MGARALVVFRRAAVIGLWLALCAGLPVWVGWPVSSGTSRVALGLQYLVVAYAGTRATAVIVRGRPAWLPLLFWFFTYIWIGLAGLAQLAAGQNPYAVQLSANVHAKAALVVLTGLVCFDVGQFVAARRRAPDPDGGRPVNPRHVAVLIIAALAVTPLLVRLVGGWSVLFLSRVERYQLALHQGKYDPSSMPFTAMATTLLVALPLVASVAGLALVQQESRLARRPLWLVGVGLSVALVLVVSNPLSTPRFWTGTVWLGLLFSLRWIRRRFRLVAVGVFAALLVVFPYLGYFRDPRGFEPAGLGALMVHDPDYDSSLLTAVGVAFHDQLGGTGGHQILGVVGFFVPRALWSDKPNATGPLLAQFMHYPQPNLGAPLWIEAYIDGGWAAVVFGFALVGYIAGRLTVRACAPGTPARWVHLIYPILAAYSLYVVRGSLLTTVGHLVVLVALTWLATSRARRHAGRLTPGFGSSARAGPAPASRSAG